VLFDGYQFAAELRIRTYSQSEEKPLALFELVGWLKYFREQRLQENLNQKDLLKKELLLIAYAILGIFVLIGFALVWIFGK
jgi:hypothetical protein